MNKPTQKELLQWYNQFKKGDLIRFDCRIDWNDTVKYGNTPKVRVTLPITGKCKTKLYGDTYSVNLWADGRYRFRKDGKTSFFIDDKKLKDYPVFYDDNVEKVN